MPALPMNLKHYFLLYGLLEKDLCHYYQITDIFKRIPFEYG